MKHHDDLGDRMKAYEAVETERRLDQALPIYARIDGRAFSQFTRGMQKPFDAWLSSTMVETAKHLVDATHARIGYTQSDEISLVWHADGDSSEIFFSGKTQKMASVLASIAAAKFGSELHGLDDYAGRLPHFDCRVFQLPSREESANAFLWRFIDARRNAVNGAAQAVMPARVLHGKSQTELLALMLPGYFESFPAAFRYGTFVRRVVRERNLSHEELHRIPEHHRPSGPVMRSSVEIVEMPPFIEVANRVEVIFDGKDPIRRDAMKSNYGR